MSTLLSPDQSATATAGTPLRILVVDDDSVDRLIVRRALGRGGVEVEVEEAESSLDAAEALTHATFDCILLDYNLPGNDGLSVLRGMKREHREIPVVILTGQGDEEVAVELMKTGAADYLPKTGLTPIRLAQSIRTAVELARAEAAARQAHEALRQSNERTIRLQQVTARLAAALSVEEVAELFVTEVRAAVNADSAWIGTTDEDAETLRALAFTGFDEEDARPFDWVPLDDAVPAAEVAREGLPLFFTSSIEMIEAYPHLADVAARFEQEAVAMLPLEAGRGPRGTIALGFTRPREFTPVDREFMLAMARQCAQALERAGLYESERRSRENAERLAARLAGAARAIVRQSTLQGVLDEIATQARETIGAHRATVRIASGTRSQPRGFAVSESESVAAWREFADAPAARDRLLAALPGSDGLPLGTIEVCDKVEDRFSSADESILEQLAQVAAAAVENVRLRERAEHARQDAEAANRAKSDFLARMSHDLRTPLNAIGGHTGLLALGVHGTLNEDQRTAVERVRRAQQHLLTLINDILSFARLEAGQVKVIESDVQVRPLVDELAALVRPEATARGLSLEVAGDCVSDVVRADRERLMQVLLNLTSNALKFTEQGGVSLVCEAREQHVAIHVQDTGMGIPASRIGSIFEPFVQARGSVSERQAGVGLGLAISRELVEKMGGTLDVESLEGEGATFTVTLRRAGALEPAVGATAS